MAMEPNTMERQVGVSCCPSEMWGLKLSSQQLHPDVSRTGHHSHLSLPNLGVLRKCSLLLYGPDYHLIHANGSWFILFFSGHSATVVPSLTIAQLTVGQGSPIQNKPSGLTRL